MFDRMKTFRALNEVVNIVEQEVSMNIYFIIFSKYCRTKVEYGIS